MATVLVVDDDVGVRELVREALTVEGYTVQMAVDGGPALDILRASHDRLVVLLGLTIPGVDGRKVLEAVAEDETLAAQHTFILMTASMDRVTELRERLNVPLLAKPFAYEELLDAVKVAAARLDG